MGMGHGANYADVIEQEKLVEIGDCKNLLETLKNELGGEDASFQHLFYHMEHGDTDFYDFSDDEEKIKKIEEVYSNLQSEFNKQTGLTLDICYHDSESEGDRYDDVDGHFWTVGGMYELTPAGKKMENIIRRNMWVTFG